MTSSPPITTVLAENLRHFMAHKAVTQQKLAQASGIAQTTISLYLRPDARQDTHKGTPASPTLAKVEQLAQALQVELWELLVPAPQRDLLSSVHRVVAEQVAQYSVPVETDPPAPVKPSARHRQAKPHARVA